MATFANAGPAPVPGGDTPGVPGWGRGAAQVAPSRGWGRLAAGRVRLLAAPLRSSKESSTTASRGRRREEVSEAACSARSREAGERWQRMQTPFPGCSGQRVPGWGLPGSPWGAGPPAPKLPRAGQEHLPHAAGVQGGKCSPGAGEGTLEHPHRDRCPSPCKEPCAATGASAGCRHGWAWVKVLAAEVPVTQSWEECGKCSPATAPREMQAGPGLPARLGSSAACTAPRTVTLSWGSEGTLLTRRREGPN